MTPTASRPFRGRLDRASEDPLELGLLLAGALLALATVVALAVAVGRRDWGFVRLAVGAWALYGVAEAIVRGVLDPGVRVLVGFLQGGSAASLPRGFSGIEAMVARGEVAAAAEAYAERARDPRDRVAATLRRAALLAGRLAQPGMAVAELEALRDGGLDADDDLRVGLALVDLHEHRLHDPGRALVELRRLLERHPGRREARRLRHDLQQLKHIHFGEQAT